jgi:hypothetical protein
MPKFLFYEKDLGKYRLYDPKKTEKNMRYRKLLKKEYLTAKSAAPDNCIYPAPFKESSR